jgi:hypothetical protein
MARLECANESAAPVVGIKTAERVDDADDLVVAPRAFFAIVRRQIEVKANGTGSKNTKMFKHPQPDIDQRVGINKRGRTIFPQGTTNYGAICS